MSKIISYGLLLATIFWLVASYLPESILVLPRASLESVIPITVQQIIFGVCMLIFVGIQISLVISMNRFFTTGQSVDDSLQKAHSITKNIEKFGLKRGPEIFWTSVPVAMTLVTLLLTFTVFS